MQKEDCKHQLTWDYLGYEKLECPKMFEFQKDWNQTLITQMNQCSARIFKSSLRGGATTVYVNSRVLPIIETFMYYNPETKMIAGRFNVVVDETIDDDNVFMMNKTLYDKDFHVIPNFTLGEPFVNENGETETIVNDLEYSHIKYCSDEQILEYKKGLIGCIEIQNYKPAI